MKHLHLLAALAILGAAITATPEASAQVPAAAKAQSIAAQFNKSKHVSKTRHGTTREKYREIRSVPAIRATPASYSGVYEVDGLDFAMTLSVNRNGKVEGSGWAPLPARDDVRQTYTLRNARMNGALLIGTKVYGDGTTQPLEAVFLDMTSFDSPTDKGTTTFGLGVLETAWVAGGVSVDKLFYNRKR